MKKKKRKVKMRPRIPDYSSYNSISEKVHKMAQPLEQREYYYIVCKAENGRTILLGAYNSELEANSIAMSKLGGGYNYEIVPLKTRDRAKATQILRHNNLYQSGDLSSSLRRMKHAI